MVGIFKAVLEGRWSLLADGSGGLEWGDESQWK